ncbi:DUF3500 domain-containing protein [Geodermatophilus ruber]|uniref:DUF3500 domain-containing protein n=1 Tax=Geodermatophilus ruber TaxID=504800 RepID=A0A1I4I8L9_9ACTN|nr:DUF3500 domain-containing protein [Geodermatophilus ruber]SFL50101.1 Protein of unknown function [Geodermatophilus ruber]
MTTADALRQRSAAQAVAQAMAAAATTWLDGLDPDQLALARWPGPDEDADSEAERLRWYYTPTDHGGLPLNRQRPAQQSLAMQLVATGLSTAGYVTVCTVMGLENVLDHVEGFTVDWGRERGRDPGLYYLRVFGRPGGPQPWGWRFGGHHVSLNHLVVDGRVRSVTPCFIGADPAAAPLLGPAILRPLGTAEDLARELVRSLPPPLRARAVLLDRAPSDIVGGNRSRLTDGDEMLGLPEIWRGRFTDPRLLDRVTGMERRAREATGYAPADHRRLALTAQPQGLPAAELDGEQRELLRTLLGVYLGRVPDGLAPQVDLDEVHLAWAGPTEPGQPHYYRLQAPRLLAEWDNTQRGANHAHSVWRDPQADFGVDALAAHRAAHHAG